MYLKEMSPVRKAILVHLKHVGHFNGIQLRRFDNEMLDFVVTRITNDEMCLYEDVSVTRNNLYFGRQGTNIHNEKWFKQFLKEREICQLAEHSKKEDLGKDLDTVESIRRNLMQDGIGSLAKVKRINKKIEIQMMIHLNLQTGMNEEQYTNYCLKKS